MSASRENGAWRSFSRERPDFVICGACGKRNRNAEWPDAQKKYCNEKCRKAAEERRRKAKLKAIRKSCIACGKEFRPKKDHRQRTCGSKECLSVLRNTGLRKNNSATSDRIAAMRREEDEAEARLRELEKKPPRLTAHGLSLNFKPTWEW